MMDEFKSRFPQEAQLLEDLTTFYNNIKEETLLQTQVSPENLDLIKKENAIYDYKKQLLTHNPSSKEKLRTNINTLLNLGFLVDEIKANSNALLVEPKSLVIRATLAKKMRITNQEFLTSGYRKQEDKVYARLCGLRASLRDFSSVYSNEKTFALNSSLSTPMLTTLFPYTEKIELQILTMYEDLIQSKKENQNE